MPRREDALSLELYLTLAGMTGIIGVVLVAIGVLSDWPLEMRVLRVAIGALLLIACHRTGREALRRIRLRRAARPPRPHPERLRDEVVALVRAGRPVGAIRLYSKATGVGLARAKREVEALQREIGGKREKTDLTP